MTLENRLLKICKEHEEIIHRVSSLIVQTSSIQMSYSFAPSASVATLFRVLCGVFPRIHWIYTGQQRL